MRFFDYRIPEMKISKRNSVAFVTIVIGLIGYLSYGEYAMSHSVDVCGRFVGFTDMRGVRYIQFELVHNGIKHKGSLYRHYIKKDFSDDSLLNVDCIRFKCSTIDNDYYNIVDNRYLKEDI